MTRKCPTCGGDGIVYSEASAAIDVERRLRALAAGSRAQAFRVELADPIASALVGPGARRLIELEALTKKRFFLEGKPETHLDHFVVLSEGKLADLAPPAPVEEDAEVMLQLVEVDRYDGAAAVGKLDGLDVVVADAASLVGKRIKVRVERVLDGRAYAVAIRKTQGGARAADRRRRGREADAQASGAEGRERSPREVRACCGGARSRRGAEADDEARGARGRDRRRGRRRRAEEASPRRRRQPKKKTRRGSRGGRKRKKPPATAGGSGRRRSAPEESSEASRGVTIHVPATISAATARRSRRRRRPPSPSPEATEEPTAAEAPRKRRRGSDEPRPRGGGFADGAEQPRRRRRRGSRGGKNRKKKPAAASPRTAPRRLPTAEPAAEPRIRPRKTATSTTSRCPSGPTSSSPKR